VKLAFFGLPLAALLLSRDDHQICFCALAPVAAVGLRRLRRQLGKERILEPGDPRFDALVDHWLERETPDLVVSWFWTRRLPARWLRAGRLGAIGVHPSLLPRHRGPNPFFAAIDAGDAETGVTVHFLTEEYDRGDVVAQRAVTVGQRDSWQLARALDAPSLELLRRAVGELAQHGRVHRRAQTEEEASWAPEPSGADLRVSWTWPTERVLRRIRGLSPVPGLALDVQGVRLVVTRAAPAVPTVPALLPGEASLDPDGIRVRTGDGAVLVQRAFVGDEDPEELSAATLSELVQAEKSKSAGPHTW
jgi:methionyl-tRNA formyltransferase